ncbi:MAG: pseudouridine-5'-phosphate glycosidase [Kiloniellaceae bacterium]
MNRYLEIREEVADALASGHPVVALESSLIAHGLPHPENLETARRLEAILREAGAVPATIGLLEGRIRIGLSPAEIERFATADDVAKVSRRDLAVVLARKGAGATTVAATMAAAALAGIRLFVTGGIGGVHRGGETSLDVSADLRELARSPVAVVCAGAKSILDLPRTLEVLETWGVPVVGYGTGDFPAFFSRSAGLPLEARVDTPEAAAELMQIQWGLGLGGGLVFANPIPEAAALEKAVLEGWIERALAEAGTERITGQDVTPVLLARLSRLSDGRTLAANLALVEHNARVGAAIACAYAALTRR